MKTHICLVSAQAAPNLLPALDPSLKPQQIVLVVSPAMQRAALSLEAVFKEVGIKTRIHTIADIHQYAQIEEALLTLATEFEGQDTYLNLTGGTKLMALVALAVAQEANWRSFYVDLDTDQVIWLNRDSPPQALGEQLRLRHYLRSYGFDLIEAPVRPQNSAAQSQLTQTLVSQIGSLEGSIAQLNWLSQQAEAHNQLTIQLSTQQQDSRSLEALLREFSHAGILQVSASGDSIKFSDRDSLNYAKGGWLESHVFECITRVSADLRLRDKAANLRVTSQGVENELDIALMAHNRLFVIECKTARMDQAQAPKANDALYKLEGLCKRIGGIGTRGMLASYRALRDSEKRLAAALNIELVCGRELGQLEHHLRRWIGK